MRVLMRLVPALLVMCAMTMPASAQDAERFAYRPMLLRMPGYVIANYDMQDFSAVDLQTDPRTHVEGRYWKIQYAFVSGAKKADPIEISHNHVDLFVKRGGKTLVDGVGPGGGTAVAYMPLLGKKVWIEISVNNDSDAYTLTIVEEAAKEQQVQFTEMELARAFIIALAAAPYDVAFDPGMVTIKPESAQALAPVGDLLRNQPSLKLEIQGHSDTIETAADNIRLSQDRAAAVKAYLVQTFGVAADRLTAVGFGGTRPIACNEGCEGGQAKNRRVELVKK